MRCNNFSRLLHITAVHQLYIQAQDGVGTPCGSCSTAEGFIFTVSLTCPACSSPTALSSLLMRRCTSGLAATLNLRQQQQQQQQQQQRRQQQRQQRQPNMSLSQVLKCKPAVHSAETAKKTNQKLETQHAVLNTKSRHNMQLHLSS
jgi:hypothetical protein